MKLNTLYASAVGLALAAPIAVHSQGAVHGGPGGELAVVSHNRLLLLERDGATAAVAVPGPPSRPAWSPDGRWVAFLAGQPGEAEFGDLWVARSNGARAHRLRTGVTQFAWRPGTGETLAFTAWDEVAEAAQLILQSPGTTEAQAFALPRDIVGFSWAPSGASMAVSYREGPPVGGEGFLAIYPLPGRGRHVVATFPHFGYGEPLMWWPNGKGLLYWDDAAGSASIAADGLPLDSLNLGTGKVATLATTLTYANWVSISPDGRTVALVAGGDRVVWGLGKHLELCRLPAATCRPLALPSARDMSTDPSFSPQGSLIFVVAPGTSSDGFASVPGSSRSGTVPFSAASVAAWYAAQKLFERSAAGVRQLVGTPSGAHDPMGVGHGLLYVQGSSLWYLAQGAAGPVLLARGLAAPSSYYGYVPWYEDFAWHS